MDNTQLGESIEALAAKAQTISEKLESAESPESVRDLKAQLGKVSEELEPLKAQREQVLRDEAMRDMKGQITSLENALTELRAPSQFQFEGGVPVGLNGKAQDYEGSFFHDVRAANRGNTKAMERIASASGLSPEDAKAMTEGTDSQGGYLVPVQRVNDVLELRGVDTGEKVINLFPSLSVVSDAIEIASITQGMTAGWVAELAEKPVSDLAFGQITASVFTAAGLGIASNQLLADSRANGRSVDQFMLADLRRKLNQVYALAILDGTGTGQPLGLLRQVGRQTGTAIATWGDVAFLDSIIDAIFALEDEGFNASVILMHPRRWQKIAKFRDAETKELIVNGAKPAGGLPDRSIYGIPVVTTKLMPTNKGTGTNEDHILVLDQSEQLRLEREGITVDESRHVYFTSNQTVFRAERRVGFTAARYPKSIVEIGGAGLVA